MFGDSNKMVKMCLSDAPEAGKLSTRNSRYSKIASVGCGQMYPVPEARNRWRNTPSRALEGSWRRSSARRTYTQTNEEVLDVKIKSRGHKTYFEIGNSITPKLEKF